MTLIIASLFLAQGQVQPGSDIVKILGKDIPIEFPTGGPCNEKTFAVEGAGWKWEVKPDGTLGRRFQKDGGWGDLRELYARSKGKPQPKPYHIKVVVIQNSVVVSKSPIGVVRQRWASIDGEEFDTVVKSLATLKASIEGVTDGAYDVKLDVILDDDTYSDSSGIDGERSTLKGKARKVSLAYLFDQNGVGDAQQKWFTQLLAPQFNDEKFETDDGSYNGPFAGVFVIHPGLLLDDQISLIDRTPVATLGYYTFSDVEAKKSLPTALFESWKQMVVASACHAGEFSPQLRSNDGFLYPRIVTGPVWQALVERSRRAEPEERNKVGASPVDLAKARLEPVNLDDSFVKTIGASPGHQGRTLVSLDAVEYVLGKMGNSPSPAFTGIACTTSGGYIEFDAPSSTFDSALSIQVPPVETNAFSDTSGTAVGDFEVAPVAGPNGSKAWEVKFKRNEPRGHVVIASAPALIKTGQSGFLSFDLKLSADENLYLDFVEAQGKTTGTAILGGDLPTPAEFLNTTNLADVSVPADDQWHSVVLPTTQLTKGHEIVQLRLRGGNDRISRGPMAVSMSTPVYSESGTATSSSSSSSLALEIAKIGETVVADQSEKVLAALTAANLTVKLTALSVLGRVKLADSVAGLTLLCRSAYSPVAELAMRGLAHQDTVEGWAVVREAVERGPFDHNRRFAAIELSKKPDPGMAASLNFMATRSWQARIESVKALSAIKSTSAQIIMAAMMQTEPHPSVRLQIVQSADIQIDLVARRFIYAAVNDSSQWVRAVALSRLIDSENGAIRSDALKGVRDDAIGVRLFLLDVMRQRAKETYRPALRIAVTDISAEVRAAALKAFATQPGPVDPNEVKNVWADQDAGVKSALQALAQAKGFKVPAP